MSEHVVGGDMNIAIFVKLTSWYLILLLSPQLRYDVQQLYKFHKKKEVDIAVDLWRFVPQKDKLGGIIADESLR